MRMSVSVEEVSGGPGGGGGGGGTYSARSISLTPPGQHTTTTTATTGQQMPNPVTSLSTATTTEESDVVKTAYRRKVKGKKKFFVLRRETEAGGPARLEYHANERKFKLGCAPKKSIVLKACFNISRTDTKCKWAVALHTHNDCVRIAMNSEEEMTEWLRLMNSLIGDEDEPEELNTSMTATTPTSIPSSLGGVKPHFEHVWLVQALNKGLGSKENILGTYRLCLTSKELTLLKVGDHEEKNAVLKFPLNVIRSVSHDANIGCFFHIEFGRLAPTGPGQLSLKTEDNNIAQNMHLLILNAMQNYSKEDLIPREGVRRARTDTWSSLTESMRLGSNYQGTPPIMTRLNSMDSSIRLRTESIGSTESRGCGSGMSPPMAIHTPPPSISFSPMCSTTDSASSSYSVDYENNNGHANRLSSSYLLDSSAVSGSYSKSVEDESYVPWNPSAGEDGGSHTSPPNLSLPLSLETTDYVETTIGQHRSSAPKSTTTMASSGSAVATPSSYMEMQSPVSPFDNYMAMGPTTGALGAKVGGKTSSTHSRNSSLIEEHDGYVPMHPGHHHSQFGGSGAGSIAGSTGGLEDDSYLDMDFTRKLNLSNSDMRRSPASSESLQSGTPSSDYPLEKVSSYLLPSDDLDECSGLRPLRAYSVGSKSDTGATGKGRFGKNRLEALQETFRCRAASVGARNPRTAKPSGGPSQSSVLPTTNSGLPAPSASAVNPTALSSSWSGSTGRWPLKFLTPNHTSPNSTSHSHQNSNSDTVDSDLMELDFSHNKKGRKRSLPGPGGALSASSIGSTSSSSRLSPCQRGIAGTPEGPSSYGNYMASTEMGTKYPSSAPISIQKTKSVDGAFPSSSNAGVSILTRMTGLDLKHIKQMDDDGAYLEMNFGAGSTTGSSLSGDKGRRRSSGTNLPIIPRSTSLNGPILPKPVLPAVVVKASENIVPAPFKLDKTKTTSTSTSSSTNSPTNANMTPCTMSGLSVPPTTTSCSSSTTSSPSLSRIEESPEKQDLSTNVSTRTNSPLTPEPGTIPPGLLAVTYAAIEHLPPTQRCCGQGDSPLRKEMKSPCDSVMYSQIDFAKSLEVARPAN